MIELKDILDVDEKIRFASKVSLSGDFLEYLFRDNISQEISNEKQEKMARHVSLAAANHKLMDKSLGKSQMTVTYRENFVSILYYTDDMIYAISIDGCDNTEEIARKVLDLF